MMRDSGMKTISTLFVDVFFFFLRCGKENVIASICGIQSALFNQLASKLMLGSSSGGSYFKKANFSQIS